MAAFFSYHSYVIWFGLTHDPDWALAAQRGDFLSGFLGTALSFATALLFLAALLFQSSELGLQREEFKQARQVYEAQERHLKAQAEAAAEQVHIAKRQALISELMAVAGYRLAAEGRMLELGPPMDPSDIRKEKVREVEASSDALQRLIDSDLLTAIERRDFALMVSLPPGLFDKKS